jgi:hypothetical protein
MKHHRNTDWMDLLMALSFVLCPVIVGVGGVLAVVVWVLSRGAV